MIAGRRHPGIVLDLSPLGIFVQTAASPPPGERVGVRLLRPDASCVEVDAIVVRRHVVPRRLAPVASSGIGLRVESVSEEFLRLVDSCPFLQEATPSLVEEVTPPPPTAEGSPYRVRARQVAGTRSKTLRVTAESEEQARAKASSCLEEGWEILSVNPARN
jgi:hypothetical protein